MGPAPRPIVMRARVPTLRARAPRLASMATSRWRAALTRGSPRKSCRLVALYGPMPAVRWLSGWPSVRRDHTGSTPPNRFGGSFMKLGCCMIVAGAVLYGLHAVVHAPYLQG